MSGGECVALDLMIGGVLSASFIDDFLDIVSDTLDNITGPYEREELEEAAANNSYIIFSGTSDEYGLCEPLVSFCRDHKLSYILHTEGEGDYNAETKCYTPEESFFFYTNATNDYPIINADEITPLINLLLGLLEEGQEALPKILNDERLQDLVSLGLLDYSKLLPAIRERLTQVLPKSLPKLPAFTIDYNS
jgi:hypothetical protein